MFEEFVQAIDLLQHGRPRRHFWNSALVLVPDAGGPGGTEKFRVKTHSGSSQCRIRPGCTDRVSSSHVRQPCLPNTAAGARMNPPGCRLAGPSRPQRGTDRSLRIQGARGPHPNRPLKPQHQQLQADESAVRRAPPFETLRGARIPQLDVERTGFNVGRRRCHRPASPVWMQVRPRRPARRRPETRPFGLYKTAANKCLTGATEQQENISTP